MKMKDSRLSDSYMVRDYISETEEIELRRLEVKRELEILMNEYAKLTGRKELKRKHKVGKAPNDWRKEDHIPG